MKIEEIISCLEAIANPVHQEGYDNAGLITGNGSPTCSGILVTLDATEQVILEAMEKNCNLVVSHHPIIFGGLKKINGKNYVEKSVIAAIKNDIAIYAIHTNLDNIISGVNARIADKLGLVNRKILQPREGGAPSVGSGLAGDLKKAVSEKQLLKELKGKFGIPMIRHSPLTGRSVSRIAVCGGAGSFLIPNALQEGAGFFQTTINFTATTMALAGGGAGRTSVLVFTAEFGGGTIAFLWPNLRGGFGSLINAGSLNDIKQQLQASEQPVYNGAGRFYIVPWGGTAGVGQANYPAKGVTEDGIMPLYQRCVHLGCRVPFCTSSKWFECPCHGSKYNFAGEYQLGPAPRGLDRFKVTVDGDEVIVDTSQTVLGPPRGTNTINEPPQGPFCVATG
jgi:dinuclear metal center YbgI/SA1388 family protein